MLLVSFFILKLSAWIKSLLWSLVDWIGEKTTKTLLKTGEICTDDVDVIAIKLDAFAKLLDLTPYKGGCKHNNGKLKPISHQEIQPVLAICPNSVNTCSDYYYISINGRYLTYFINP